MQRINTPDGQFHAGDPSTGALGTVVTRDYMQALQEEIAGLPEAVGIVLDPNDDQQVLKAIRRLVQAPVVLADTGAANAYAAVNAPPLVAATWVDDVIQRINIAHANTGAATYAPDGLPPLPIFGMGLQALQGSELKVGGTAILVKKTIAGVNGGNPICVLLDCYGGAKPVAPATQSQHVVQFGQVSGVVGQVRNLFSIVTTAGTTKAVTADEVIVETALGGLRYCLSGLNLTGNLTTQMDTGSAPTSGFVAEYAIYNPSAPISATNPRLLYTNATAAKQPEVYGGANPVAGYTASALISVWPTNALRQFSPAQQVSPFGRRIGFATVTVASNSGTVVGSPIGLSGVVPLNAKTWGGSVSITLSSTGAGNFTIYSNSSLFGATASASLSNNAGTGGSGSGFGELDISTPQQAYIVVSGSGTVSNFSAAASYYTF